ncbi:serine hydrolase [Sediminibacterium soli]|uniref:serine hydrolase n=1 Tax=Sediminibacterium soli TaxID=2698829 RepID=UPI001F44E9E1|nr:serine hydrolase [Sediminibacterium soli]
MVTSGRGQSSAVSVSAEIKRLFAGQRGVFAMAFRNSQTGETILINEQESFHAASTMKTPVMIELFRLDGLKKIRLTDSVVVRNSFSSIVDSSGYSLNAADDGQQELYTQIGTKKTIGDLLYQMIIKSSNLATNLLIELADARQVTQTMRQLGAEKTQVLRGVEDSKAYRKGWNNTTTALDLMTIYDKMARAEIIDAKACDEMIGILLDQQFNEIIPAKLPKEVRVAHKTGSITGVQHDSGIVLLPDGRKYVLVLLSKNLEDEKAAVETLAAVSELVYRYASGQF